MHDFDELIDRKNTNSMKWLKPITNIECSQEIIPMWVADMDFRVAQPIINAIQKVTEIGIFGYATVNDSCKDAIIQWQENKYNWSPEKEWIVHTPGVVTALNLAIQAYTTEKDEVLIQTPVYIHFHQDVETNRRKVIEAPLKLVGNRYIYDAEQFEAAITPNTKLFILSNPHNPTGNVWSDEELNSMVEICVKHHIIIVSDEIHQDLVLSSDKTHTTIFNSHPEAKNISLVCTSPSKTFNIAGLQISNIFIANHNLREKFQTKSKENGIYLLNNFAGVACEAAYRECDMWLDNVKTYIIKNKTVLSNTLKETSLPIKMIESDATYLIWLDCRELGMDNDELHQFFLIQAGVWLDEGKKFSELGNGFMRINLACPTSRLQDALARIINALQSLPTRPEAELTVN
ncbi:MalY/PatB family protein [Vibrio sp. TH_r3]|uniref:MalY/PatB family protein n=1 Tax=Vibrio sp. TH_r3 TaxID=3082084 RepID=UPI002952E4B3|nr:MalY/PatB family protein [Vibrio sp. TH_r3]MDV7106026.1 MalY/PatB family protein [Vibrio sp. TH_r3]